jgi:hypothetical protein
MPSDVEVQGSGFRGSSFVSGCWFWQPQIAAGFIRFIGLIGLISSIGSVYTNQFNQ